MTRITGTVHENQFLFLIISRPVLIRMGNVTFKFVDKITT